MAKEDADFPLLMGNMKTRPYGIVELLKKVGEHFLIFLKIYMK